MEKLTRAQINERLAVLRESKLDDESFAYRYMKEWPVAMCYSVPAFIDPFADPPYETEIKSCSLCGQPFEIAYLPQDMGSADKLVEEFRSIGLEAKLACHCPSCIVQRNATPYEIHIRSVDEQNWHISKPRDLNNPFSAEKKPKYLHYLMISHGNKINYTSNFEYRLALKFLTIPEQINDPAQFFDDLFNKKFRSEISDLNVTIGSIDFYCEKDLTVSRAFKLIKERVEDIDIYDRFMRFFESSYRVLSYKGLSDDMITDDDVPIGFFKTQLDVSLYKVLGLSVVYDTEEMKKNIEYLLKYYDFDMQGQFVRYGDKMCADETPLHEQTVAGYIEQAFAILEKTGKRYFYIYEYTDFITDLFQELQHPFVLAVQYMNEILYSVTYSVTYNDELRKILFRIGQAWMINTDKKTFSNKELLLFVKQVLPQSKLRSDDIKNIFINEIKSNRYLCQYIKTYALQHGAEYDTFFDQIIINEFLRPLSESDRRIPFCALYNLQEEISQIISAFIGEKIGISIVKKVT